MLSAFSTSKLGMQRAMVVLTVMFLCFIKTGIGGEDDLLWPIDATPALSSSFCEYRPGHYHSAIDAKVWGSVGLPCRAVADGYVYRVKVSPSGYGKALYLRLKDGRSAVYAHLRNFASEVDEYILQKQHETIRYNQDVYFEESEAFRFKKGEILAYSGRSGTTHPHLHFELRDQNERPINPLLNGYTVADHVKPIPVAFLLAPMDKLTTIENQSQPRLYDGLIEQHDGIFRARDPIGVTGRVGISIKAFDRADGAENILAVSKIELLADGQNVWTTSFTEFGFEETRQVEFERDYRLRRLGKGDFHRLYRAPGNELKMVSGDGIVSYSNLENKPMILHINLEDVSGNRSIVEIILVSDMVEDGNRAAGGEMLFDYDNEHLESGFPIQVLVLDRYLRFLGPPGIRGFHIDGQLDFSCMSQSSGGGVAVNWYPPSDFNGNLVLQALDNVGNTAFSANLQFYPVYPTKSADILTLDEALKVEIPVHAVFDTTWLRIKHEPEFQIPGWVESVYRIDPQDQPLNRRVNIFLKLDSSKIETGWGIYYFNKRKGWSFMDNQMSDDYFQASALSWERFGLVCDNDNPVIRTLNFKDGSVINKTRPNFKIEVKDSTSGLSADGLEIRIDDKLVPAQWDPPIDLLSYEVWKPLERGEHNISILARDMVGNQTGKSLKITINP